ncbi:unnamed protein product [Rhodiola kirilowii]
MAPSKRPGKEIAHSDQRDQSHNYHPQPHDDHGPYEETNTDFVRKGSSSWIDPRIIKKLQSKALKDTRIFIRPVEPNSFSPPESEEYISFGMESYFEPEWKDLEDVNPEMLAKCFRFFEYMFQWAPDDEESIRKCFHNRCAELLMERLLPVPAGKSKQSPTQQSSRDTNRAGKSKRVPDCPSQEEYYSPADPAGNPHSMTKRAKGEMLVGDQNMQIGNFNSRHDTGELKNKHCRQCTGTGDAVPRMPQTTEEWESFCANSCPKVRWSDAPDEQQDPNTFYQAIVLAEDIKNEILEHIDAALPSVVRDVVRRQCF